jgi:nitrite reductase (NO-forming)
VVTAGNVAALASVAVGAGLATVFLAGWMPLLEAWARARPAHAWLNLIGFVSLTIATTLLHFFPTVIGARIARHRSAIATVGGLAAGPALVALGGVAGADPAARVGALVALAGAVGLAVYAWQTWRTRARWTSDAGWHLVAMGGLVSAIGWFVVGMGIAAGRMVVLGVDGGGWSLDAVAGPLVAGWMGLAFIASATHLIPAIGPGSPVAHAEQRRILGRVALPRLLAIELGVAALAVGLPLHLEAAVAGGMGLVAAGLAVTIALAAAAIRVGLAGRTPRTTVTGA